MDDPDSEESEDEMNQRVAAAKIGWAARVANQEQEKLERQMGPNNMAPPADSSLSPETGDELARCGILLTDGCLGYNRHHWVRPGVVWSTGEKVAVKLYNDNTVLYSGMPNKPAKRSPSHEDAAAAYAREMNIVAGMDMEHPHLMRILSWSAEPGRWVCCELFDANLFAYMRNVRPWSAQAHLFTQILVPIVSAVGFLHSKNYVHKDISPHHVMFLNDLSRVVLSGHKLSKTFKSQTTFLSSAKRGEIHWMDPNCYSSNTCYAFESDVYSLGVILGELLTGDLPYNGDSHGCVTGQQISGEAPFHLSAAVLAKWPRLCAVFRRCTLIRTCGQLDDCDSAKYVGGGRPGGPGASGYNLKQLQRPSADEMTSALLEATEEDVAGALEGRNHEAAGYDAAEYEGEGADAMDVDDGQSEPVSHSLVIDTVHNSHNLGRSYKNCVVQ